MTFDSSNKQFTINSANDSLSGIVYSITITGTSKTISYTTTFTITILPCPVTSLTPSLADIIPDSTTMAP